MALVVVFTLAALLPDSASACSCAALAGTAQERAGEALSDSTAVFSGEAIDVDRAFGSITTTFRVSEVWKGPERETVSVSSSSQSSACGYGFRSGREYLVYAREDLSVDACGGTTRLAWAGADLEALGEGATLPDASRGASGLLYLTPRERAGLGWLVTVGAAVVLVFRLLRAH